MILLPLRALPLGCAPRLAFGLYNQPSRLLAHSEHPRPAACREVPRAPQASPGRTRTHSGVCFGDENIRAAFTSTAEMRLGPRSRLWTATGTRFLGHGGAITATDLHASDTVILARHPSQQAAHHLPCGRPPDGRYQKAYQELIADIDAGNAVSLDKVLQIGLKHARRSSRPVTALAALRKTWEEDCSCNPRIRYTCPNCAKDSRGNTPRSTRSSSPRSPPPTTRFQVPARPGPRRQIQRRRT